MPVNITVSQALDWWKCPQFHWYKHVLHRSPTGEYKGPADLGTLMHSRLEVFMKVLKFYDMHPPQTVLDPFTTDGHHWAMREELERAYLDKGMGLKPNDRNAAETLEYRLNWWATAGEWKRWDEIILIEKPLTLVIGQVEGQDVVLHSKPDVFVVWNDKIWHVQWKSHSKNFTNLSLLVESSMHEATFKLQVEDNPAFKLPFGGTLLGAFDKDALHSQKKGAKCPHCKKAGFLVKPVEPFVKMTYLDIHDGFVSDARIALLEAAEGIAAQINYLNDNLSVDKNVVQWPRNLNSCADIFKQHICGYRAGVCQRRTTIMDQFAYVDYDPQSHYTGVNDG